MKKQFILLAFLFLAVGTSFAQRIVYVDTEYILKELPAYSEAQTKLEEQTKQWQEELQQKENELITKKAEFEQEKALMPKNLQIEAEATIQQLQNEYVQLKNKRFGANGDLYQLQQSLIQPIQDKVYNAVKKMADQRDYDFVLDKSTGVSILFVKPKFDMSDEVLRIINLDNN